MSSIICMRSCPQLGVSHPVVTCTARLGFRGVRSRSHTTHEDGRAAEAAQFGPARTCQAHCGIESGCGDQCLCYGHGSVLRYFSPESQIMTTTVRPGGPARSNFKVVMFIFDPVALRTQLCARGPARTAPRNSRFMPRGSTGSAGQSANSKPRPIPIATYDTVPIRRRWADKYRGSVLPS